MQKHPEDEIVMYPAYNYLKELGDELAKRGKEPKLKITSLPELNTKIWGLRKGLTVIGARTSQGKTTFSMQLANDLLEQGKVVLIISLEMSQAEILERMYCSRYEVNNSATQRGIYSEDADIRTKFGKFCQYIEERKLIITYGVGKTFEEVNEMIDNMPENPDLVIVDYIQSIKTGTRDERAETNEYIRKFRELSYKRDFCGILVSQINRGALHATSNEPHMGQLKTTGVLEEHADVVILLHWDYFYTYKEEDKSLYKVIIAKNRNGRTGKYYCEFYPEFYKFKETHSQKYYKDKLTK